MTFCYHKISKQFRSKVTLDFPQTTFIKLRWVQ